VTVRERFEKVRNERGNRFSLRTRLTILVMLEMLVCVPLAYGLDILLRDILPLPWDIPFVPEMFCVSLLVGTLVTGQMSKYFFKPIKKLRSAMEQVAQGDYSVRVNEHTNSKELVEIYTGFNLMVNELQSTEILQTDFVSNVSHEFKTPINAIEGYSTLLQDGDNLDENQKAYVEKILYNTRRLSSLVGSILLLSKLESQQIPSKQTHYRLDEQVRQSIVAMEPAWERKNIEFDVDLERIEYLGNEQMMRHVWDNLLSNGIKFSPEGGVLRLRLSRDGDRILFTVEDQGPGMSEETKKHAFDKFYQADSSHKQEGNGLGLPLVKRILSIEKGQISVENRPEGGCRFAVTLWHK